MGFSSIFTGFKILLALGVAGVIGFLVWKWDHMQSQIKLDQVTISQLQGSVKYLNGELTTLDKNVKVNNQLTQRYIGSMQTADQSYDNVVATLDKIKIDTNITTKPTETELQINNSFNQLMDCISISTGSHNEKICSFDSSSNFN